jgi:hypothetical protein
MSIKALARLILQRDRTQDNDRVGVSRRGVPRAEPARQSGPPLIIALGQTALTYEPIYESEPALEQPCAARRGQVRKLNGAFVHFCCRCGRFGAFGYGVRLRAGQLGRWYCGEHRPD